MEKINFKKWINFRNDGNSNGKGSGYGYGSGYSYGYGSGYGYGDRDDNSNGYGSIYGIKVFKNNDVFLVDDMPTLIYSIRGNIAKGAMLNSDLALTNTYIARDGNGNFAHGVTIQEARESLVYKITDRDKSEYEALTLNDTISHNDAIICYRTITGACEQDVRSFVKNLGEDRKDEYTISEIINLTKGQYGSDSFKQFFKK